MQKNKLNLHICGIHLLNPYKTVVSHLNWFEWCTNVQDCNQLGALKIIVINMTCPVEISHYEIRVSICV